MNVGSEISKFKVSVLPDFFFDRIISVPSLDKLFRQAKLKAQSGGGNLRGFAQTDVRGGNAANLAFALASLSVKTTLYCVGDEHTQTVLSNHPCNCRVRVIPGKPGHTTALEFSLKRKPVNVMISDVGGIREFDGRRLSHGDLVGLKRSNCIALVNWSANRKGNALARKMFELDGRKGRLNFLDPADLDGAERHVKILAKEIIERGRVDVVSLNENETRVMARVLSAGRLAWNYKRQDLLKVADDLQNMLGVTLDVHTPIGSVSSTDRGQTWVGVFGKVPGFVTGAGDIWDAGDIVGHLLDFQAQDRLIFANACAYLYLKSRTRRLPRLVEVSEFLASRSL